MSQFHYMQEWVFLSLPKGYNFLRYILYQQAFASETIREMFLLSKNIIYSSPSPSYPLATSFSTSTFTISPHWVTGFGDRAASFSITISLRKSSNLWTVTPLFEIMCSLEHLKTLEQLKSFFGVGLIYVFDTSARYRVTKLTDLLTVIIPHFTTYPLLGYKWVNYTLWVRCLNITATGIHTTSAGLWLRLPIYAAMNRGASATILRHFPNFVAIPLPVYYRMLDSLNPWWVTGYLCLWAQLTCGIATEYSPRQLSKTLEDVGDISYHTLWHTFTFSRGFTEAIIMSALADDFAGKVWLRKDGKRWDFGIAGVSALSTVLDHFNSFPIPSILSEEFLVWEEFVLCSLERFSRGERHSSHEDTLLDYSLPKYNPIINRLDALRTNRRISK